ncbi:MAG: RloB domain-containing protein [Bacteroidales bacterium]|nr:RloB domain-containing protein [Bacteroidales bacterium]
MMERIIRDSVEEMPYFASKLEQRDLEGYRDMNPLFPFIISGGSNTERWYFNHISSKTNYKFNIYPQFFGNEANYTEEFPIRINKILRLHSDAVIYCVFDWETIHNDNSKEKPLLKKHQIFKNKLKGNSNVILCPSMPCIEYWFLLHFKNTTRLIKSCKNVCGQLADVMKDCFDNPNIKFSKLLKQNKYLEDSSWVEKLCANGKLQLAIQRAEDNIQNALASNDLENQSFSFVYIIFKNYPL